MNLTRLVGIFALVVGVSLLLAGALLQTEFFTALTGAEPESFRLATLVTVGTGLLAIKFGR